MTNWCFRAAICWVIIGALWGSGGSVPSSAQDGLDPVETAIKQDLRDQFGGSYRVGNFIPIDSVAWDNDWGRLGHLIFEDPHGTLQGRILFSAKHPKRGYLAGVYQDGQVQWTTDRHLSYCDGLNHYSAQELNLDGEVELVVRCVLPVGPFKFSSAAELWIYRWDGQSGKRINALANPEEVPIKTIGADQRSVIVSTFGGSFGFVDLDGDGVEEIKGIVGGPDTKETGYWSWNGELYGDWPSTPEPPSSGLYPADVAEAAVEARVVPLDTAFAYRYTVESLESSKRRIDEFLTEHGTSLDTTGYARGGWDFYGSKSIKRLLTWSYDGQDTRKLIRPGEQKTGFGVISKGLPAILPFYVRSENKIPRYDSVSEYLKGRRTNSYQGRTVAPTARPEDAEFLGYLDTLRTYPERARQQGWITTDAAASRYEETLNAAYDHLAAADSVLAQQALAEVAAQAQADSGDVLTSEGYALLYYNADYLAQRLPDSPPGCGQVPATAEVNFETTSVWGTGYNAQIEITNTGDTPIRGWTLDFSLQAPINSLWNGQLAGEAPTYTVADMGNNAVIAPGQSQSVGFQVQHDSVVEPTGLNLNAVDCATEAPSVDIGFETTSTWGTGYNAQIAITNTGDTPIRGWRLGFELEAPIVNLWNGQLTGEAPAYTVTDAGHNGIVAPGETVTFGLQVQNDTVLEPSDYAFEFWAVGP